MSILSNIYILSENIVNEYHKVLNRHRRARVIIILTTLFFSFAFTLLSIANNLYFKNEIIDLISAIGFTFFLCLLYLTTTSYFPQKTISTKEQELIEIKTEREDILKRITDSKTSNNATATALLNLNRITEYYTINLGQAKSSYRWSIISIVAGTLTLGYCIWSFTSNSQSNMTIAVISGISSIIMEFIGGCYFYMYRKSLSQLNLYFKELLKIQETMLAIELCEKLADNPDTYANSVNSIIQELLKRTSIPH